MILYPIIDNLNLVDPFYLLFADPFDPLSLISDTVG